MEYKPNKWKIEKYSNEYKRNRTKLQVSKDTLDCLKDIKYWEAVFLIWFMLNMVWIIPVVWILLWYEKFKNK